MNVSMARRFLAGLSLFLALASPFTARAGTFQISPLALTITRFGDVTVTNTSQGSIRFSISAFAWSQTPHARENRASSDDIVYFPQVFALDAGASQRIRVGITATPGQVERPYRLFVSELPPFDRHAAAGQQLLILSRIDIPVFQPPSANATTAPRIDRVEISAGSASVTVANDGTEHVAPSHVGVALRDAAGSRIWAGTADVWYVLARSSQSAELRLPEPACNRASSAQITWNAGGQTVTQTVKLSAGSCR